MIDNLFGFFTSFFRVTEARNFYQKTSKITLFCPILPDFQKKSLLFSLFLLKIRFLFLALMITFAVQFKITNINGYNSRYA